MSVTIKTYFNFRSSEPEIRRFSVDADASTSYDYLVEKIRNVYPTLKREDLQLFWKDEDNELVIFSSDDELIEALTQHEGGFFRIYVQVASKKDSNVNSENQVHPLVTCDGCGGAVVGSRFKCSVCPDYDLCCTCEAKGLHAHHHLIRIRNPGPYSFIPPCPPWFMPWMNGRGIGPRGGWCGPRRGGPCNRPFRGGRGGGSCPRFPESSGPEKSSQSQPGSADQAGEGAALFHQFGEALNSFLGPFGVDVHTYAQNQGQDGGCGQHEGGKSPAGQGESSKTSGKDSDEPMNPGDRLPLSGILDHPFILGKRNMQKNFSSESLKSQSSGGKKQCDSYIDSGNSTMATILTGISNPYQSKGSLHSNSKPVDILPSTRSGDDWPRRNRYHPSSPPVRERSSHNHNSSEFSSDGEIAPTYKQPLHSTSWLNDFSQKLKKKSESSAKNKEVLSDHHSSASTSNQQYVSLNHERGTTCSDETWRKTFLPSRHNGRSSNEILSGGSKYSDSPRKELPERHNFEYSRETERQRPENSHSSLRSSCMEKISTPHSSVNKSCDRYSRRLSNQHEAKEKKVKSISDVVEPLNAQRLKPIRQKARNAVVSITELNEVCLEFLQQREQQEYVMEVIRISCNGMKVTAVVPNGKKGVLLTSKPLSSPSNSKSAATYLYCSLPLKYWKKYQYAARFVDLVRKKTPKITLYTKLAKCMLMENSPNADFEASFYDGGKIHQSRECTRIVDPSGVSYTLESMGGINGIPNDMRSSVEHLHSAYEQCLHLDRVLTIAEEECHGAQFFPIIVCRRPMSCKETSAASRRNSNSYGSGNDPRTPTSPSAVTQLSTMKSFIEKMGTTHEFSSVSMSKSSPSMLLNQGSKASTKQKNDLGINPLFWQSRPKTTEQEAKVVKSVFVADVGWSSQLSNGEIWMQYNDGSQLVVNPEAGLVKYTDKSSAVTSCYSETWLHDGIDDNFLQIPK